MVVVALAPLLVGVVVVLGLGLRAAVVVEVVAAVAAAALIVGMPRANAVLGVDNGCPSRLVETLASPTMALGFTTGIVIKGCRMKP